MSRDFTLSAPNLPAPPSEETRVGVLLWFWSENRAAALAQYLFDMS